MVDERARKRETADLRNEEDWFHISISNFELEYVKHNQPILAAPVKLFVCNLRELCCYAPHLLSLVQLILSSTSSSSSPSSRRFMLSSLSSTWDTRKGNLRKHLIDGGATLLTRFCAHHLSLSLQAHSCHPHALFICVNEHGTVLVCQHPAQTHTERPITEHTHTFSLATRKATNFKRSSLYQRSETAVNEHVLCHFSSH